MITINAGTPLLINSIPLFPSLVAGVGIAYFGWTFYKANKRVNEYRQKVQRDIINQSVKVIPQKDYYLACAGSNEDCTDEKVRKIDVDLCNFCDHNKKPLDVSLYDCYVVQGDSMKYAGINDGDILFVPKDFKLETLTTFPVILVLRYGNCHEEKAKYKVRRTWFKGSYKNLEDKAKEIIKTPKFRKLTLQSGFKGEEWMLEDLKNKRLKKYMKKYSVDGIIPKEYDEVILSTTYDTKYKEIHFSIHPISLIVGNVEECYTVDIEN